MANVINMGGGGANVQSKTVKSSQTQQTINPPEGVDGFNPVIVSPFTLQSKTATPSTAQQTIKPDKGVDALSQVTVEAAALQYKVMDITGAPGTSILSDNPDTGYIGFQKNAVRVKNGALLNYKKLNSLVTSWSVDLGYYTNTSFYIMAMAHGDSLLSDLNPSGIIAFCAKVTNNVVSWESAIGKDYNGNLRKMGASSLSDGRITISGTTLNITLPVYNGMWLQMEPYYITYQIMSV